MTGLFAADGIAVFKHIFKHVAVADFGALAMNSVVIAELEKAHIAHHSHHGGIFVERALRLHIFRADGNRFVAVDNIAGVVHGKHTVGVAVKSET